MSSSSDDNTGTEQAYTYGHTPGEQIAVATARGLEFLAITDHNRVISIHQPDYRSDQLVLVPGYEHSLPDAEGMTCANASIHTLKRNESGHFQRWSTPADYGVDLRKRSSVPISADGRFASW